MIPEYLKQRNCWVLWRLEDRRDKDGAVVFDENGEPRKTKVPYRVSSPSRHASSTNPKTWAAYTDAVNTYRHYRASFNGIGCVLDKGLGVTVIDLDHCIMPDQTIERWAADILPLFADTYTEKSQSDTGFHIFALGSIKTAVKRKKIEMYDTGRFIAMTGHAYQPFEIAAKQPAIDKLYKMYHTKEKTAVNMRPLPLELSDAEIVEKAAGANFGFYVLYFETDGWRTAYPSQSEADLRLCSMLAFWCNRDPAAIDRIFRTSALYREKWNEKHGSQTYGQMTIQKAVNGCRECYAEWYERKAYEQREKRKKWAEATLKHWDDSITY